MTPPLDLWPEARTDIREARDWYEGCRAGLGHEFLAAVREILATVEKSPLQFPRVRGEIRRARLARFPYAIFYLPEKERTIAFACFHARRNPKVWQARLVSHGRLKK
jgi:plasmid stabilization system protein ParE